MFKERFAHKSLRGLKRMRKREGHQEKGMKRKKMQKIKEVGKDKRKGKGGREKLPC
jgi:hypothetical protein